MCVRWMVAWACVTLFAGCAGYQMGNRSLYRTDLRTVHVPMFQSDSLRPDLGEWLTEAVIKEIELRTPYKVSQQSFGRQRSDRPDLVGQ